LPVMTNRLTKIRHRSRSVLDRDADLTRVEGPSLRLPEVCTTRVPRPAVSRCRDGFGWLPVCGPSPVGLQACGLVVQGLSDGADVGGAGLHGTTGPGSSRRATAGSVASLDRYRPLRKAFRRAIFDELCLAWRRRGDAVFATRSAVDSSLETDCRHARDGALAFRLQRGRIPAGVA
jgi:hypothetical protein